MGDFIFGVVTGGLFLGSLLVALLAGAGMLESRAEQLQRECELNLPRTEKCVMRFVPEREVE